MSTTFDEALTAVREDDAMLQLERLPALDSGADRLRDPGPVVRMDAGQETLVADRDGAGLEAEDPIELVRPGHIRLRDLPRPAADVCERLRLGQPRARLPQLFPGRLSLGERRGQQEEADRRDRDQRLDDLHALGGVRRDDRHGARHRPERPERTDDQHACRRAQLPKAKHGVDEHREDQVRVPPATGDEHDQADADERADKGDCLEEPARLWCTPRSDVADRDEKERRDHQDAGGVAEPPEHPARAVRGVQLIGEPEDCDAVRRGDRRARAGCEEHEREHIAHPAEAEAEADPPQEGRPDHGLERVPDGDRRRDGQLGTADEVAAERADGDRRPESPAEHEQGDEGDATRRPHRSDHALRDGEADPEPRARQVRPCDSSGDQPLTRRARHTHARYVHGPGHG